jgi:hypothetical protein
MGEVLASQGWLRPEEFARYSEEQRASGERLSEFLIKRGVLTRIQLLQALRVQTYRLLLQVLRWREGEFKFYSGEEVSYEAGVIPISVEEVLLRSVGDLVGEGTMSGALPHGFVAYEPLAPGRPLRVGTREAEGATRDTTAVWITPDEKVVLEHLDGRQVAAEVARRSGLGEYKTLYALFRLLQLGLARPAGALEAEGGAEAEAPAPELPAAPAPRPAARERPTAAAAGGRVEGTGAWFGRSVALVAAAVGLVVTALAIARPSTVQLPFPGQRETREALEKQRRLGRYLAIDRAARTYVLLEGRYPEGVPELIGRGLLPDRSAQDPSGRPLELAPAEGTYELRPVVRGEPALELGVTESVSGDFLIDPTFFAGLQEEVGVPLVLLD